jgi:SNARE protein
MTTSEITKAGLQTQEKTQESTARTKKLIQETIEIGMAANSELKDQGAKILKIEEDVEQVESNLKRADRQMRIFIRRMASDRIFMILIVLLGAGILAIVVLTVLQKKCIGTEIFKTSTWVKTNCPTTAAT